MPKPKLKDGADALFEPSPYTRYVLQDDKRKSYWTGRNPASPVGWTRDIDQAKVIVGLAGVVESRKQVSPIVEIDARDLRITYFREIEGPAKERTHA